MSMNFDQARFNMVEQQVRPWDVLDANVLAVLTRVPREEFVAPEHRALAFADLGLPLAHGEFMMKPVVEGRVLQALALTADDSVLEIGTGSGFLTACLASLAHDVLSVEQHDDLAVQARTRLAAIGTPNVRVEVAEAILAFQTERRFDAIVLTGATHTVPTRFLRWLKPGGRLFAIRGESPVQQAILLRDDGNGRQSEQSLFETDLPYLSNAAPPKRFTL